MNVLDAVRLASMPRHHQVCCLASLVRRHDGLRSIGHIVRMMVDGADIEQFETEIALESRRQKMVASERRHRRTTDLDLLKMGAQLSVHQRLNRLCPTIYGPIEKWAPFGPIVPMTGRPVFNWLKRDSSGAMISGLDRLSGVECSTGFVVKCGPTQPSLYSSLSTRARSFRELMVILGLPLRFLDGRPVSVEWSRREFIVGRASALPWVYP